jgi:hypothetical protein
MKAAAIAQPHSHPPLRGTQLLVEHMGEIIRRPLLVAIEIAWRWLFGIPFLMVCWKQGQQILAAFPLESSGFDSIDMQNPWVATGQIEGVVSFYEPHVVQVLRWLLPVAALAWVVISGFGRSLLLTQLESSREKSHSSVRWRFRPFTVMILQAAWLCLLALAFWMWLRAMHWVAAAHIPASGEPDLVGYATWAILLGLAFFTAWALMSWAVSIAPLIAMLEERSAPSALGQSLRLGGPFSSKLAEIDLVMGIVKLALLVVAMVFSAAPLPFSDELGAGAMHMVWAGSTVFFLIANDYFQVVRLKAFLEFWKVYRGPEEYR